MGERSPAQRLAPRAYLERLSEAIAAQRNANTRGIKHVAQRPDGSVLSERTTWWTYDLSGALEANEGTWMPSGARLVPIEVARSYLIKLMEAEMEARTDTA